MDVVDQDWTMIVPRGPSRALAPALGVYFGSTALPRFAVVHLPQGICLSVQNCHIHTVAPLDLPISPSQPWKAFVLYILQLSSQCLIDAPSSPLIQISTPQSSSFCF